MRRRRPPLPFSRAARAAILSLCLLAIAALPALLILPDDAPSSKTLPASAAIELAMAR
ncbi:MAG: hypothetical protein QM667_00350 [Asticcacaulis sp.]